MQQQASLADTLGGWARTDKCRRDIANTVMEIAEAGRRISELIAQSPDQDTLPAGSDASCEEQIRHLTASAKALLLDALSRAPVAVIAENELGIVNVRPGKEALCAALMPLDGVSDIETHGTVGTVFSLLPALFDGNRPSISCLLQPGTKQVAAGYIVYGPRTSLTLTLGEGTQVFTLDRRSATFRLSEARQYTPTETRTIAIDASNGALCEHPIKSYVDDWITRGNGRLETSIQVHRNASLVAACHRVLLRGGMQIYPAEVGDRGTVGSLSLVFQANPIAWLVEQAGGAASTGIQRLLEIIPSTLHQHTPLVFGSREQVEGLERFATDHHASAPRSPLFFHRGLFLADEKTENGVR